MDAPEARVRRMEAGFAGAAVRLLRDELRACSRSTAESSGRFPQDDRR